MRPNRFAPCVLVMLGLLLSVVPVARAQPSVLDVIPPDAWGAVIVRDLKGLNDKVVALGQELGLPIGPGTMVGDPLTMLKGMLGAAEGLNDKGSVAAVVLKPDQLTGEALRKCVVLLVPCAVTARDRRRGQISPVAVDRCGLSRA